MVGRVDGRPVWRIVARMTEAENIFCREFVTDFNATRAYLSAHPHVSRNTAGVEGHKLLKKPKIRAQVDELIRARCERLDIQADDVLRLLWQTVTADPNELVQVRRIPCRHCYGQAHRYQFTPAEWEQVQADHMTACQRAEQAGKPLPPEPDPLGGITYDQRFPPFPDCPECGGDGVEKVVVRDTRELSPAARQLYAGAKVTKNGVEILTHSRDKALELIGRHLAMFTDNVDHKNNGGSFQPMSLEQFYGQSSGSDS